MAVLQGNLVPTEQGGSFSSAWVAKLHSLEAEWLQFKEMGGGISCALLKEAVCSRCCEERGQFRSLWTNLNKKVFAKV